MLSSLSPSRPSSPPPAVVEVTVPEMGAVGGLKLDRAVAQALGLSRRQARLLIGAGHVRLGGRPARILARRLAGGSRLQVDAAALRRLGAPAPGGPAAAPAAGPRREAAKGGAGPGPRAAGGPAGPAATAEAAPRRTPPPLSLLYLDRHVVAVNKPAGLLSEPDRFGAPSVEGLLPALLRQRGEPTALWLVHRLDAGTSGVLLLARTAAAARRLHEAFRERRVHKVYWLLCQGRLPRPQQIAAPLGRLRGTQQGVRADGKPAATAVRPLATAADGGATWVEARPHTGRTHQIRVHMAHLGLPLLGDRLYGGPGYDRGTPCRPLGRPMLHAHVLDVVHPHSGLPLRLQAAAPADFARAAAAFALPAPAAGTAAAGPPPVATAPATAGGRLAC